MCEWLLNEICEKIASIPLIEFNGVVHARVYRCKTSRGEKCYRVDPEVPEENYDEEIYEVPCKDYA